MKALEFDSYMPLFRLFVFLSKRLIIVQITIFSTDDPFVQVLVYIILQFISCSYVFSIHPMKHDFANYLEMSNESFVLMTGYFMILFTDFVDSNNTWYEIGKVYAWLLTFFIGFNLFIYVKCMLESE